MRNFSILVVTCLVVLVMPATVAEAQQPIPFSTQTVTPIVIDQSGGYILTRDLSGTGPGPVLRITASNVSINLNGMTLTPSTGSDGIEVAAGASAKLFNGSIVGGERGIFAETGATLHLSQLQLRDMADSGVNAVWTDRLTVRKCTIQNIGNSGGAHYPGFGSAIIANGSNSKLGIVEENDISDTFGHGILLHGATFRVSNNRICEAGDTSHSYSMAAIEMGGTAGIIENNTVTRAYYYGITVSGDANTASGNSVTGTMIGAGIQLFGDDHLIKDNVVTGGLVYSDGINAHQSDRNRIEDNVLNSNAGFGLFLKQLSDNNVYSGNVARNNGGSTGCCCVGPDDDFCDEGTGNTSQGDNWMPGQQ